MVHRMSSRSKVKTVAKRTSKTADKQSDENSEHDKRKKKRKASTTASTNKNKRLSKSAQSAQSITGKHFFTPTSSRRATQVCKSGNRSVNRNLTAILSQASQGTPHTSTPVAKKKKTKESTNSDLDDSFKEYKINGRTVGRWTMLDKATKDFVTDSMNASISSVIQKASQEKSSEIFSVMNELRNRLMEQLSTLKAPANRVGNYKTVLSELTVLRKTCTECERQQEKLELNVNKESEIVMTLCTEAEGCGLLVEENDSE